MNGLKIGCYSDILQGILLVGMFVAIQLATWGVSTIPPAILSLIPTSPLYATLAPITSGDLILLTLISGYGAIWGLRMISDAIGKLQEINSKYAENTPAVL